VCFYLSWCVSFRVVCSFIHTAASPTGSGGGRSIDHRPVTPIEQFAESFTRVKVNSQRARREVDRYDDQRRAPDDKSGFPKVTSPRRVEDDHGSEDSAADCPEASDNAIAMNSIILLTSIIGGEMIRTCEPVDRQRHRRSRTRL